MSGTKKQSERNKRKELAIKPIKQEIRLALDQFLTDPMFKDYFIDLAHAQGFSKVKTQKEASKYLFEVIYGGEISFINSDLTTLFTRYQQLKRAKEHLSMMFDAHDMDIEFSDTDEENNKIIEVMDKIKAGEEICCDDLLVLLDEEHKEGEE